MPPSPPSPMSPASALPLELIHTILEADYLTSDGDPDRRLLLSSSLVCNAWSTPAQQLLFTNVVLRSKRDFYSFRDALRQPSLANAVRTLRVILDNNQPQGLRHHHLAAAIALCPRLNSISLTLFGKDESDSGKDAHDDENNSLNSDIIEVLDRSRSETGAPPSGTGKSPITSFHLNDWSAINDSLSLQSLLASLPEVKLLSIGGVPPTISNFDPACNLSLTHLRINFQQSPSVDFLRWLLDNSRDMLTALDLERLSDSDASIRLLDHLTTNYGTSLKSLILPSCSTPTELKHFQRCTNLRSIAFRSPSVSPSVFKHLLGEVQPATVEDIYFCVDSNTVLSPVIEFVRNKETLKRLVVCLWEQDVRRNLRLWGSLKMACAVHGVELKVVERLSEYKALIKSDFERV